MRILIVEDDERIAAPVADDLRRQSHVVDVAADGVAGLDAARSRPYDIILLDVLLPGCSGIEICRSLRRERSEAMIVMVTARDATDDKVTGLDAGADDYVVKPFDLDELSARLRALGRRQPLRPTVLRAGPLALDADSYELRLNGTPIALTPTEFALLEAMMRSPRRVFSPEMLRERAAQDDGRGQASIKSHVANLRRKLREGGLAYDPLETVYGNGYRLAEPR